MNEFMKQKIRFEGHNPLTLIFASTIKDNESQIWSNLLWLVVAMRPAEFHIVICKSLIVSHVSVFCNNQCDCHIFLKDNFEMQAIFWLYKIVLLLIY